MQPASPDPPEVTSRLWQGIRGHRAWDVGANCGQLIPRMLTRFTHVVAYEPAEECLPYLTAFPEITVRAVAVSDRAGSVDLVALPDKINTGQLVTDGITGMEWSTDTEQRSTRTVAATTLDAEAAELGAPDFVKIDVEGHEQLVLDGAADLIKTVRPVFLIEFHSRGLHTSCTATLEQAGYRTETVRHPHYPPGSELWHEHGWFRAFPTEQP